MNVKNVLSAEIFFDFLGNFILTLYFCDIIVKDLGVWNTCRLFCYMPCTCRISFRFVAFDFSVGLSQFQFFLPHSTFLPLYWILPKYPL